MEEYQATPQAQPAPNPQPSFILPPHSNKMGFSIAVTLLCCLIGGVVSIIYASKSNSLYSSAMMASDSAQKQMLYNESEAANKTAQTWIIVSLAAGALYAIFMFILGLTGALADYLDF